MKPLLRAWYANCLAGRGESEAARTEIDQARADHPSSPVLAALSGRVAYLSRDAATAIRECDEAIALEKNLYLNHVFKGHALRLAGEYGEALKSFTRACELNENNPVCLAEIAHLHGLDGRDETARTILTSLHAMAESRYISRHVFAHIYLGLRETGKALEFLMRACDEREAWLIFLTSDPVYDPLREHREFLDLVRRVGFTRSV